MTSPSISNTSKKIPGVVFYLAGVGLLCLVVSVCSLAGLFLFPGKTEGGKTPEAAITKTVAHPAIDPQKQTWLVMLYLDADDPVLEEDILFDLNEAEMAGSTERVKIVAQVDRYKKGYKGDGNWSGARRYELTRDSDLTAIKSNVVKDMGEIDMSDPDVLTDFATWAIETYPADRHVLILSDHGMGWPGGWTDADNHGEDFVFISLSRLEKALATIVSKSGIKKLDLVGMDACLMGMLEVYSAIAPYAGIAIASEEVEPGLGWAYADFLSALNVKPGMSPAELGKSVVNSYIQKDQRILNKDARARFLKNYGLDPATKPEDLITGIRADTTLAAVDLAALPDVQKKLNDFARALKDTDQKKVADSRSYARAYTNTFDDNLPSPYLDLSHLAAMLSKRMGDGNVSKAVSSLRIAINSAIIAESHGPNRKGSTGMSIFFPVSELYWNDNVGVKLYTKLGSRFAGATLWDDFLAYHYAGQEFDKGVPEITQKQPAPGLGQNITIAPLRLSSSSVRSGEKIRLQTEISGSQIAYVYILMLLEKDKDNYLLYYLDYFRGVDAREEDGVYYPVWKMEDGKIPIDINWTPASFGVCNGKACSFCDLTPETFGKKDEQSIYSNPGRYIFTEDGLTRDARMYFRNDEPARMTHIIGYTGSINTGIAASAIHPVPGDEWQFLDSWLQRTDSGGFAFTYHDGNRIAFGDSPFYFGLRDAAEPAKYRVAIMVEDMDGNNYFQFAPLEITE